jgi:hypothetical protein
MGFHFGVTVFFDKLVYISKLSLHNKHKQSQSIELCIEFRAPLCKLNQFKPATPSAQQPNK